ncbi:MAG: 50S ribosomal protein L15 [Chloroflexi bacterium]|nr:50S ribosomal protein L15 [Chloroflexota bacterium]
MKINDLKPNEGSKKPRKRVGHGLGAGQGKTAGRGTKGQSSRAGKPVRPYLQGGNLPFFRRLPFMRGEGFTPPHQVIYNEINLDQLQIFPAGSEITPEVLAEAALLRKPKNPVALLGRGDVKVALKVHLQRVTKSAQAKIEAAGGTVETS